MPEAKIKGSNLLIDFPPYPFLPVLLAYMCSLALTCSSLFQCDGKRPICSACIDKKKSCEYLAEDGVSSQAATRKRLEGYATVVQLLQQADPKDCRRILRDLREPRSLASGVKTVLDKWLPNAE